AAIFTPAVDYPMVCCNMRTSWYRCDRDICRIHMLAKAQAWHANQAQDMGPGQPRAVTWDPRLPVPDAARPAARKTPDPREQGKREQRSKGKAGSSNKKSKN